jgi:GNAT superfamily N-acetyltransferase
MGFTHRHYRGHDLDAAVVLAFLSRISLHPRFVTDYHIGDFVWRTWRMPEATARDSLAIWTNETDRPVAIGWFDPPREFAMILDPALSGKADEAELIRRITSWADERYRSEQNAGDRPLGTNISRDDAANQTVLSQLGFEFSGETWHAGNFRPLNDSIPEPVLPAGYRFESMESGADLDDRVEIHREVWAPSKFTRAIYDQIRAAPVYRADLDLTVRAPDGRYASYLIGWWDPEAHSGLLEPVGARPEYRRQGLTAALINETLRRFQELGADRAFVNASADDVPSNELYRSVGFARVAEWQWWHRPEARA